MTSIDLPQIVGDLTICLNLPLTEYLSLPTCQAVYLIFVLETNQVIYVGKTRNLRARCQQHRKIRHQATIFKNKTVHVAWFPLRDSVLIEKLEREAIRQYQPVFNSRGVDPRTRSYKIK